jgi:ElaB/YqjD/DUF883 family membrane-anchored ribosome-binding protein
MFKKLFSSKITPKNIIIVSGLPRSGTSMMMKMLAEGGLEIVSDAIRAADNDNPNGYFEFEPVKQLVEGNFKWLADGRCKAIKVISSLLEYLPREYNYKVIFMERDLREVLASQQKMLKNRQEQSQVEDNKMRAQFENHLSDIKYWLARQSNMDVLYINYNKMLSNPQTDCARVAEFVEIPMDMNKMQAVPNGKLYRNRAQAIHPD